MKTVLTLPTRDPYGTKPKMVVHTEDRGRSYILSYKPKKKGQLA